MNIKEVQAYPISFSIPDQYRVKLGIGQTIKRDAVLVKVTTESGIVGWGEAHAARAPSAMAELINTTLRQLVIGRDASAPEAIWDYVYRMQIASHGMGTAAVIGLSGIDLAIWDIRGKSAGQPLHQLLGGKNTPIESYAGGVSLGYQPPAALIAEIEKLNSLGYRAIKLRVGDSIERDVARIEAVRTHFGDSLTILVDANTAYTLDDALLISETLSACDVEWLEEPFPPHYYENYRELAAHTEVALAAGENHYTRFDFFRMRDDQAITVWQPDLSKCGGLTEALRIASLAAESGVRVHPHTSLTGINMAASIHFLSAIGNAGYFEADVSVFNPFRDHLSADSHHVLADGTVKSLDKPGIGIEIDEALLNEYPVITGPGYI
ncbi:MAG: mandelate racemase/muconate lactonizing enzyme family protein [Gammaproteobacteria bacterium]